MVDISQNKKIEFIFNSNKIEEIYLNRDRYKALDNSQFPEISGHAIALDYMLENYKNPITEYAIQVMHGFLMKGLVESKYCGHYRNIPVYIGGHEALPAIAIKPAMEKLVTMAANATTEEECWNAHHEFEHIHPFIDGNGRVGRLILNWVRLRAGLKFHIVYERDRWKYYESIENYRRDADA